MAVDAPWMSVPHRCGSVRAEVYPSSPKISLTTATTHCRPRRHIQLDVHHLSLTCVTRGDNGCPFGDAQ